MVSSEFPQFIIHLKEKKTHVAASYATNVSCKGKVYFKQILISGISIDTPLKFLGDITEVVCISFFWDWEIPGFFFSFFLFLLKKQLSSISWWY